LKKVKKNWSYELKLATSHYRGNLLIKHWLMVYRTNCLFEQFLLKKTILSFLTNSSLMTAGTPLIKTVRCEAAPWLARR